MFETAEILPSYLSEATVEQKKAFFQALVCLSDIDGHMEDDEVDYIMKAAKTYDINSLSEMLSIFLKSAIFRVLMKLLQMLKSK